MKVDLICYNAHFGTMIIKMKKDFRISVSLRQCLGKLSFQLKLFILLIIGIQLLVIDLFAQQNKEFYRESRIIMGTFVEVTSLDKQAADIVFDEMERIDKLLSIYNSESEISKLNSEGECSVSPETFYVIKKAKEFYKVSNRAFDITVGPLLDLWGITDKNYLLPDGRGVRKTLKIIGSNKIILNESNNVVKFKLSGMKIDLGAIAKGYAVDLAVEKLKESGINNCLINAGGDIYCLGNKLDEPWRVAIKNPQGIKYTDTLKLEDKAVATSGDYEQYFIYNNKRYSHIIDPRTGYPADSGIISVTVIAPDCLTADALATAIMVMGKERGIKLAVKFPGVEIKIIERSGS